MTKNEKKIYHILCDNVKRCRTYVISSTNTTTHITRATLCRATTTYDHTVPCFCCTCVDVVERTVRIAHQYTIYARVRRQPIVVCFVKSSPKKSTPNRQNDFIWICAPQMERFIWNGTDERDVSEHTKNANKRKRSIFGNRFLVVKMTFYHRSICQIYSNNWQHIFFSLSFSLAVEYRNCVLLVPIDLFDISVNRHC